MTDKKGLTDEELVEGRLRHFINKYYRIKILQGLIISVSFSLIIVFLLILFGNAVSLGPGLRNLMMVLSFTGLAVITAMYLFKPLAQRLGWLKGLNFREASGIIQQKHKPIEDRIINIIELTREKAGQENRLYDYAIAQKTENIRDFNFDDAISFKKLGNFLIRLTIIIAIFSGIIFLWPDFVKKGIGEIWSGNVQISLMKQVKFEILNDSLEVESGRDFLLRFRVNSEFPVENVSIKIGSSAERAGKVSDGYEYLFKAVNSSVPFKLAANEAVSDEFVLRALLKPEIGNLKLKIVPPAYTGQESTLLEGYGNAEVPAGSRVLWTIKTVNTDELLFVEGKDTAEVKGNGNLWNREKVYSSGNDYEILCRNRNGLSMSYIFKISVVKDLYPSIDISESRDSLVANDVYVQGIVQDDYGFSKLEAVESRMGNETSKEIRIKGSGVYENFYYTIVPDSNSTVYFFRIWDNDRNNGPKFTESRKISLRTTSRAEVETLNSQLADSIKSSMKEGMSAVEKMEKKLSEFKMEQVVGDLKPWEIQERMKELNDLKKEVVDFINNISKTDKEFTENEQFLNQDKEFTEKAKQIQDLMENLLDDEMKELLKQFEELAKEFNSKKADELTDKMEFNLEKLKEQMEMSLELLKKYDMEKDLMKQVEKLNQLADSLQNAEPKPNSENNLKEEFKKWEQEYEKKLEQDQQYKKPMGLEKLEKEREEVRKAAEELDKKESSNSAGNKKSSASKSLKKLAKKMESMLGMMNGGGESVDLEDLRQIRNSLNDFSYKQEDLNSRITGISIGNPTFTGVLKDQKVLENKFLSIRDSLKSIGYKQPLIAKIIGGELFHVETSFRNLYDNNTGNRANTVRIEQNRIMTEVNSMAVKLDELIRNMENAKGSGSGDKGFTDRKKPKEGEQKGSEKMGEAKSQQQSMKEQLKSAIQKMKSGTGGKKERADMARMLGEREMMRKALEKALQDGGIGKEGREKANDALNMMKEVEKDIIYNRLSDQTLQKDNLIRTKLLEAENAEKERENENRRESKEFKGSFEPNRKELENLSEKNKGLEQTLKFKELKLKSFYQEKYLKYMESTKK